MTGGLEFLKKNFLEKKKTVDDPSDFFLFAAGRDL